MRAVDLSCRMDSLAAKRSESTTLRLSQMKFRLPHATIIYVSLLDCQCTSVHGQFRHIRMTRAGTFLVAHMDLGKVVEYSTGGKEIWSAAASSAWAAVR